MNRNIILILIITLALLVFLFLINFNNKPTKNATNQEISKEALMSNAPDEENGFFKVPKIN